MVIGIFGENCSGKSTPAEAMLERRHGVFEDQPRDALYDGAGEDPAAFCDSLALLREAGAW